MAARQTRGCPSTGRCQVTLTMLKHRRSGRSGVCGLSNARWLWHLERFSARLPPKSYQYLAKLTVREPCRSFKARARHTLKVRRCPPPRRPARARLARAASRPPPRRPGTTTRRDAVCCCGRAGHGSAHVTAGTDVPARSALTNLQRDRGSFLCAPSIERAALCAHSPAASRAYRPLLQHLICPALTVAERSP